MALNNSSVKQYLVLQEHYEELKKIYTMWAQIANGASKQN